jgi:hypothetical protein
MIAITDNGIIVSIENIVHPRNVFKFSVIICRQVMRGKTQYNISNLEILSKKDFKFIINLIILILTFICSSTLLFVLGQNPTNFPYGGRPESSRVEDWLHKVPICIVEPPKVHTMFSASDSGTLSGVRRAE